jgi:hypothetical protein
MDDDFFTDNELELIERGVDRNGSPRVSIASQPIRDGSRALLHDGYDVQLFHDAAGEYPKLAELIGGARKHLITAPALICDVFWSFFKHALEIRPVVPLTPAHQLHANILITSWPPASGRRCVRPGRSATCSTAPWQRSARRKARLGL